VCAPWRRRSIGCGRVHPAAVCSPAFSLASSRAAGIQARPVSASGSRQTAPGRRRPNRLRSSLVVAEVALALVLVAGAALLIRTFVGLSNAQPGIDPHNVLTMATSLTTAPIPPPARSMHSPPTRCAASRASLRRGGRDRGVYCQESANGIDLRSISPASLRQGRPVQTATSNTGSLPGITSRRFRIPLLRGRRFTETDTGNATPVVDYHQHMAKRYWPNQDPIGQVIHHAARASARQFADPPRESWAWWERSRKPGGEWRSRSHVPSGSPSAAGNDGTGSPTHSAGLGRCGGVGDPMALRAAVERQFRPSTPP